MADNPFKFWEELKRRKVVRVITVYAAAAYVILELTTMIVEPLGLPAWTINFVLVLLFIGFIITALISWIYDFTSDGIKKTESVQSARAKETNAKPDPVKRKVKIGDIIIGILLVVVIILAYPHIFKKDKFEDIRDADGRISVAVMPFENQTRDTTLNWFERGVSSLIINGLGNSSELIVYDYQITNEVIGTNIATASFVPQTQAREAAEKLNADVFLTGSFQVTGDTYYIISNLVNTMSGDIIWTKKVEGDLNSSSYHLLAGNLINEIKNYLEIQAIEKELGPDLMKVYTESAEAYRYYIEGMNFFLTRDNSSAIKSFEKAYEVDSTFTLAALFIAFAYNFDLYSGSDMEALKWVKKAYETKENLSIPYQYWVEMWYAGYVKEDRQEVIKFCQKLEKTGIQSRLMWYDLAVTYSGLQLFERSLNAYDKVEAISLNIGEPWYYPPYNKAYATALHKAGVHDKEKEITDIGLSIFSDLLTMREMYYRKSICALSRNDSLEADIFLERYLWSKKEVGQLQDIIENNLGNLYREANMFNEAETHFRKAIKLNPQNDNCVFSLASVLITEDLDINEGMALTQRLLEKYPNSMNLRRIKGYGLYKLGRFEEALQLLEEAKELDPVFWDNEIDQYIQKTRQALAKQNSE